MSLERRLLFMSCVATSTMALFEMWFGYTRQLRVVHVDGLLNVFDACLVLASFWVVGHIYRSPSKRLQYGYWHWETWLQCVRGGILLSVCLHAAWGAGVALLTVSTHFAYHAALLDASLAWVWSLGWCRYIAYRNRTIRSALIAADVWSWQVSATLNFCLLAAGLLIAGIQFFNMQDGRCSGWLMRNTDAVLTLVLTVWMSGRLSIALWPVAGALFGSIPTRLDDQVRTALRALALQHGLGKIHYRAQPRGRCVFVDVYVQCPEPTQFAGVMDAATFHAQATAALEVIGQVVNVTATFVSRNVDVDGFRSTDMAASADTVQ